MAELYSNTEERFWAKVRKDGPVPSQCPERGPCWLWTASTRHKGYGAFAYSLNGKLHHDRAHRYVWRLYYGDIPIGICVLHHCDTPACVNPIHLWLGTKAENNADMQAKGRKIKGGTYSPGNYHRGERWYAARGLVWTGHIRHRARAEPTTPQNHYDYEAIQWDRFEHHYSYPQLARKYGCSRSHAHRICQKVQQYA